MSDDYWGGSYWGDSYWADSYWGEYGAAPPVVVTWLSGWDKRVKLTIDSSDVTNNLLWFPVLVHLSTSSGITSKDVSFIFDELQSDANRKRIAVTKSDGITQLYVEIEKWDDANEQAWLHTSRDNWTISHSEDTTLYLYYDRKAADNTTFVGDPNSAVAEKVWDDNFKLVCHMDDNPDTSHVRDSTSNDNDGTKKGANEPIETTGKIGKGQDLDGNDDRITVADDATLNFDFGTVSGLTLECWVKTTDATAQAEIIGKGNSPWYLLRLTNGKFLSQLYDGANQSRSGTVNTYNNNVWHHVAASFTNTTNVITIYVDGSVDSASYASQDVGDTSDNRDLYIGYGELAADYVDTLIDETRISNKARSSAWAGANYETQRDHFITYGNEEILTGIFLPKMLGPPVPRPDFPIYLMMLIRDYVEAM